MKTLDTNKAVCFSATLEWEEDLTKGLFKPHLLLLRAEKSSRFDRGIATDRLLVLCLPAPSSCPEKVKDLDKPKGKVRDRVTEWLACNTHFIIGRQWYVIELEYESIKLNGRLNVKMLALDG
jgi:hypothetical protein